jgi:hypothetical protein
MIAQLENNIELTAPQGVFFVDTREKKLEPTHRRTAVPHQTEPHTLGLRLSYHQLEAVHQ